MLNTDARAAAPAFSSFTNLEFLRVELAPAMDGGVFLSLIATTVDDEDLQLIDQELLGARVDTLDAAIALLGEQIRRTLNPPRKEQ